MLNLRDRPIRQKITWVIMMIAGVVLLLAFAALFCFQAYTLKQHSAHELAVVGEITAHNCAAAVMFKDEDAAAQILGGLRTMPQIVSARLELANQQRLAFFGAARDETEIKAARLKSGFRIEGDRILLAQPVMISGAREGTLYLLADLHATTSQLLKLYGGIFALVLVASLLVAFILSSQFLHIITTPILQLAGTARTIADHNDYSVRATKVCSDEVGVLTDAFNQMLAQIQSQDTALRASENKLAQAQRIVHLGYWERDLETDRLMWSDETYGIFGLSAEETVNNFASFQELIHSEDRQMVMQAVEKALRGGPRYDIEYRVVRPSGEVRYVHSQGDAILDESGQPRRMFGTLQDITERKHAEEALRRAEQKYRSIFENAIEGVFQTTPRGTYISVNPALARMYGYGSAEELIESVSDIANVVYVNPQRRTEFKRLIGTQGFVEGFEYEVYRKDRSKIWLCENARAVRGVDGAVLYYEGSVQDITERKRVEEVERASKAKSEFLSRMSHELRTPLNAILGFGQLLERQHPTETQLNRIRHILTAGRHLLNLINEILDLSRIEAGRIHMSLEPVCVADAVSEAVDLIRPLAAEREMELSTPTAHDENIYVMADRQRCKQVLLNLLTNAVKYTPRGGKVGISFALSANGSIRVIVTDTGSGIPSEKISRLFTPFERLGAEQSTVEGTGLGLALSQRLVQAMHGSIGVESTVGQGSTFWVELPCATSPLVRIASRNGDRTEHTNISKGERTILYVEDNLSNLTLIEQILMEQPGTELITAMQGRLALDLARQHAPDLILLDLHLPDMPGWEVLRELQQHETTRNIPVVIVSADATSRQIKRLMAAGARAYLTKPIDVAEFFRVIEGNGFGDRNKEAATTVATNGSGLRS